MSSPHAEMDADPLRSILRRLAEGELSIDEAQRELRYLPFTDLGFAKVDHHREVRVGFPETVYGPGKTPEQVAEIVAELVTRGRGAVMVTRATQEQFAKVGEQTPDATFHPVARLIVARAGGGTPAGVIAVTSAGTSDLPVAEEAAFAAEALGCKVERIYDVGVAGVHRLFAFREDLDRADAIIVVAGMDGVLPSLVGGLVRVPVIAVPTSVGYGAGEGGIAPLLTMLNSCAPGVAVVNIDNGFGAAVFASVMLRARENPA